MTVTYIARDCLYTLEGFKSVMSWGDRAYRNARRNGFPVVYVGTRAYVIGGEAIDWFVAKAKRDQQHRSSRGQ